MIYWNKTRVISSIFLFALSIILMLGVMDWSYAFIYGGSKWPTPELTWYYNQGNQEGCTNAVDSVKAAAQTWTDVPCSDFRFIYGGLSSKFNPNTMNGENTVAFGTGSSSSWIGLTLIWGSGGVIYETDMFLNKKYNWSCSCQGGKMDVQNIATHEFGHFLSLNDLYGSADTEKTMYGYASLGECIRRTLHQDDMDGISFIYPGTPLPSLPQPIVCLSINPTIDGTFSPTEWDGTKKSYIDSGCAVSFPYYMYVANDDKFIYVCIDAVGDDIASGTHIGGVYFDTGNDNTLDAGSEDAVEIDQTNVVYHKLYNGAGYDVFNTGTSGAPFTSVSRDESGMIVAHGYGPSDNSSAPHHFYEFKIPMVLGDLNTFQGDTIGLFIYMLSKTNESYWPASTDYTLPSTYGKLIMSTGCATLPSLPGLSLIAIIVAMLTLSLLVISKLY